MRMEPVVVELVVEVPEVLVEPVVEALAVLVELVAEVLVVSVAAEVLAVPAVRPAVLSLLVVLRIVTEAHTWR